MAIASMPRRSRTGVNALVMATALMFASRLTAFNSRKRSVVTSTRLKAWVTRTAARSSCRFALTSPIVCRV